MTTFGQSYPAAPVPPALPPLTTAVGVSGTPYQFQVHQIGTSYFDKPGVYIFMKMGSNGRWDAVYIGETSSFKRRLTDDLRVHHQWRGITYHGATHIATLHVPGSLVARETIETDLRQAITTPCNLQ